MRYRIQVFLLTSITALASVAAAQTATIAGKVTDSQGAPISGAYVTYETRPALVSGPRGKPVPVTAPVRSRVLTGKDGSFQIDNLSPADYYLCAYGAAPGQLTTCVWTEPYRKVSMTGQDVGGVVFQIQTGTVVKVDVADPGNLIRDVADLPIEDGRIPLTGGNFVLGIFAGSHYEKAALTATATGQRTYQVTVPGASQVRLFVGTQLSVSDAIGNPVKTGQTSIALSPSGQAALTYQLTVH